jgi:ribosomal protein S18 acetylase RimI-like enzyme
MQVQIRERQALDIVDCVQALFQVHQVDKYPTNWPADPVRWMTPADVLQAWVAVTNQATIVGHVMLRPAAGDGRVASVSRLFVVPDAQGSGLAVDLLRRARVWAAAKGLKLSLEVDDSRAAAIALYERTGWRRTNSTKADWTTPDGEPITLHHYTCS